MRELNIIRKYGMTQFFTDQPFITQEVWERDKGKILEFTAALRKVTENLKDE